MLFVSNSNSQASPFAAAKPDLLAEARQALERGEDCVIAVARQKKIGLTLSDAFRLLLVRVAAEKALPFEPFNPNAETVAAMKAARRGELVKVGKLDKLALGA